MYIVHKVMHTVYVSSGLNTDFMLHVEDKIYGKQKRPFSVKHISSHSAPNCIPDYNPVSPRTLREFILIYLLNT